MIIKNNLRPTAIHTNSRFRGPTELEKYTNFVLETVHDLKLLGSVMDRNDFVEGHKGQTDFISDNFAALVTGGTPIVSNIDTASTIYHPIGDVFEEINLLDNNWSEYGECQRFETEEGVQLHSNGLLDPCGIATQKYVEEGDIIYIRVGIKLIDGKGESFSLGSHDIGQGEGDITRYKLPQNGTTIYVDKRLYCKHREPISINIDVTNLPDHLEATTVEITSIEMKYLREDKVKVQPVDTAVKSKINNLDSKLRNIINNI